MATTPAVGVLALQGDVREHQKVLTDLGAEVVLVRTPAQLEAVSGLVIPGGESSVIDKLSRIFELADPIRRRIEVGMPVFGTCAGLILLADRIANPIDGQETFGGLDVTVRRNAFGGQAFSFETDLAVPVLGAAPVHAAFIRAPVVTQTGPEVEILASLPGGEVVAVRQGSLLGTAFHPEVSGESRFHALFLQMVEGATRPGAGSA